jgi:hypothetical protein
MSQSYKTVHDFQSINVGQTLVNVQPAGTSITLGNSQSGDLNTLNATSGSSVQLPVPSAGLNFPFLVTATAATHTITAPASTLFGAINCAIPTAGSTINVTNVTGSTTLLTTTGSCVGDRFTIVSDGTSYFVSGTIAKFNGIKFQ